MTRGQKLRSPISTHAWRGPFSDTERTTRYDAMYAVVAHADDDADDEEVLCSEIQLPRDEVIGIWQPLTPISIASSATVHERIPAVKLAATLPPGFDRPDWSVERVLGWLRHRNLAELRTLELADPKRPEW